MLKSAWNFNQQNQTVAHEHLSYYCSYSQNADPRSCSGAIETS